MFVSRGRVGLRVVVLPFLVMVRRLKVMVGCGGVVRGGLMVRLDGGMLALVGHVTILGLESGIQISRLSAGGSQDHLSRLIPRTPWNRPEDGRPANTGPVDAQCREGARAFPYVENGDSAEKSGFEEAPNPTLGRPPGV